MTIVNSAAALSAINTTTTTPMGVIKESFLMGVIWAQILKKAMNLSLLQPDVITTEVEALRPGSRVRHIHMPIDMEDRRNWIMRIRRRAIRQYPDEPLEINLRSEVATNQVLHTAGVAVPESYMRPEDGKHHPKLIYCYQTWLEGDAWKPFMDRNLESSPLSSKSLRHINDLAKWFISMEKVSFRQVGSPEFAENGKDIGIGPLIERHPAFNIPPYYQGPFRTSRDRWIATINSRISLILSRTYCNPKHEVVWYLVYLEAKRLIEGCEEMRGTGPFYIKHDDDRFDHIRANEDGTLTGILDWEWAYTTNKEEAFASPAGFVPDAEYRSGQNDCLSTREVALADAYIALGREDLATCVRNGRKYHRLINLLRHSHLNTKKINALERAFLDLPDAYAGQPDTLQEWVEAKKVVYREDEGLIFLLRQV
uniref:Aminoglycoside phosphotransferase domain-containing protein n=1 Tax=Kwoniella dejecticola CBS 10117 TaxID=1296121 RepID=A0A1A6A999_9TREE|nr:uncharacterized protein I303_02642 [Kwoniella dejecticola CBS 10117]OBR86633.1 hypothetical protein I303_02642 [Kwoniella dejecticola CBS 10117]